MLTNLEKKGGGKKWGNWGMELYSILVGKEGGALEGTGRALRHNAFKFFVRVNDEKQYRPFRTVTARRQRSQKREGESMGG